MDKFPVLPLRGATDGSTFKGTPGDMAPLSAIRNFRAYGVGTKRPRGSKRPCLKKLFSRQLKNAAVQAVATISRATGQTGFSLGECNDLAGFSSIPGAALVGQLAGLDDVPSMDWFYNLDVTPAGGPADNTISSCAFDPDGEFLAAASNYPIAGFGRFSIIRMGLDGVPVWGSGYFSASHQVFVNTLCVTKLYTFAAIANTNPAAGAPKLIAFRNDTGAIALQHDLFGWARQAVAMGRYVATDGVEYLYVAFDGQATAGTYTGGIGSGVIRQGRWALQFRSGILKFRVDSDDYGGSVLTRVAFGTPLASTGAYYEAAHGTWRLSEQTFSRPHGGEFTGLACGSDGSVYFTKRNQGWGPNDGNALFFPNGTFEPYATVGKISPTGELLWMQDTDSIKELDDLGNYNDLSFPGDASPDPSLQAIAVDAAGNCYVAGRRNAAAQSVFSLTTDGVPRWFANVMPAVSTATVREAAMAYDVGDNTILVGGDRNDDYDGATPGEDAHLWKINATTGDIVYPWDINENVSALCVCVSGTGKTFYGMDAVS